MQVGSKSRKDRTLGLRAQALGLDWTRVGSSIAFSAQEQKIIEQLRIHLKLEGQMLICLTTFFPEVNRRLQ